MKYIEASENDDERFLEIVQEIISGTIETIEPDVSFVVKMDNWFGEKWLGFSHKVMGAFGVACSNLSIPPFVPERVMSQRAYVHKNEDQYSQEFLRKYIHVHQSSEENEYRKISSLYPLCAIFWWSGNTKQNGRGCVMPYIPSSEGHAAWYVGLSRKQEWEIKETKGISRTMLESYRDA